MTDIQLKNIYKKYDNGFEAVKDFNLDIHGKEFVILVGPSGCGKSTTLRMIAGLEKISEGEMTIDGEVMNLVEPQDRNIAMVFQNYALYPHMTVRENIAYSLKIHKVPKKEIDARVDETAKMLDLEELLDRKPNQLSGGQKQRVAMGRAMIRKPKVFLMDEPLSNLDAKLRSQMRVEIASLYERLDTTFIYVTHDQTEAMTLGTKIVVMKDGLIQQVDTPQNIYDHPVNKFVAGFVGAPTMNFIECEVEKEFDKTVLLFATTGPVKKVYPTGRNKEILRKEYLGKRVTLGIRPEDIYEYEEAKASGFAKNSAGIRETVVTREMLGAEVFLYFDEQHRTHAVRLEPSNQTKVGETVDLYFDPNRIHIFDIETEENILNLYRKGY